MFLVLITANLESSRAFYEHLGCRFDHEQHETGLAHFSVSQNTVFELYPPIKALVTSDQVYMGFEVENPDQIKAELVAQFGGKEPEPTIPTTKSGIATLRDPAGILVRLFPAP